MAKFNIESIMKKFTNDDGNVDYSKVNDELQEQNNGIVAKELAKNKPDENGVIQKFLNDNEFKSMDDFNAFKKNGATADTEAVKRLEKERDDYKSQYETTLNDYGKSQNQLNTYNNQSSLRKEGISDNDQIEFLEFKINKLDGENFKEKLSTYKEANPDTFNIAPINPNIIKTTGTPINNKVNNDDKLGWEKILDDKYGI